MSLVGLIVLIAVAAVVLWGITQFPTLDPTLKRVIQIVIYCVVAIVCILFVARMFGYSGGPDLRLR